MKLQVGKVYYQDARYHPINLIFKLVEVRGHSLFPPDEFYKFKGYNSRCLDFTYNSGDHKVIVSNLHHSPILEHLANKYNIFG